MGRLSSISHWGNAAWVLMHVVSFTYPDTPSEEDRARVFRFMSAVAESLPCLRCRDEWTAYLRQHLRDTTSAHLDSKRSFATFVVGGHNFVNERLGKRYVGYGEAAALFDPMTNDAAPPPLLLLSSVPLALALTTAAAVVVLATLVLRSWQRPAACHAPSSRP